MEETPPTLPSPPQTPPVAPNETPQAIQTYTSAVPLEPQPGMPPFQPVTPAGPGSTLPPNMAPPTPPQQPKRRPRLWPIIILILIIIVAFGGWLAWRHWRQTAAVVRSGKPNIIFILTDDESLNLMKYMPNTNQLIGKDGAEFSNYFDNISLCCAARASILRGQYAHNDKIEDNAMPNGGFEKYYLLGEANSDIGVWMKNAGYDTSLMGKYLNQYPAARDKKYAKQGAPPTWVPPGWEDWFVPVGGGAYKEYNYTVNDNGKLKKYGDSPSDYMVDVISQRAANYITAHKDSSKPYFMYLATYAPHYPYTAAPRYVNSVHDKYPVTPAFNEADVSDKPTFISQFPALTSPEIKQITKQYDERADAVKGVDDLVKNVYDTLQKTGQLNNTYLVFTSDNGYHMGEHRLGIGKYTPYETDDHLPLFVRGPGIKAGSKIKSIVGNIDLAPTFAAIGGAKTPSFVDGESMLPFLRGQTTGGRQYYLLERAPSSFIGGSDSQVSTNPEEPADPSLKGRKKVQEAQPFQGVRSENGYMYVKYGDGEEEYYNLNVDPYEINNLLPPGKAPNLSAGDAAELAKLKAALTKLQQCAGSSCIVS